MSRTSATVGLLTLLLLAAGLAVWRWPGDGGGAPPEPALQPVPGPGDPSRGDPPAPASLAAGSARVWIEVHEVGRLTAPAVAPVVVRRGEEEVQADAEVIGGVGAAWPVADPRSGSALVRVAIGDEVLHRVVQVPGPGMRAELTIGAELPLRGRVVDMAGKPVAGANVWFGGAPAEVVATDAEGRFAAAVPAGDGIPVVVRADGLASGHRVVAVRYDDGAEELYVLAPESRLEVQLVGDEDALQDATVRPVPLDEWTTELLRYPFFAVPLLQQHPADGRGVAVVAGLPLGARIGVVAGGPRLPVTASAAVELRSPSERVTVPVRVLPLLRGTIGDEDGRPVAGAAICCWPRGREPRLRGEDRWLLLPAAEAAGVVAARTDEAGAFAIARPDGGACVLRVRSPGRAGLEMAVPAAGPELRLVLPRWREGAELRIGPPVAGAAWAARVSPFTNLFAPVPADQPYVQRFVAPMLADLSVRLQRGGHDWSAPLVLEARAVIGTFDLATAELGR
jgi:hypothetical protein